MFSIEVVMAAYNNPVFTALALEGFTRQSDRDFSVVIADDGSGPAIAQLVERFAARGLAMRHVWQEDRGFRKAAILNKAIATSTADYLVFVDNDCIPQSSFIADHRRGARRGHFVAGRRVNTKAALKEAFVAGRLPVSVVDSRWWLLGSALRRQLRAAEFGLRVPWPIARLWSRKEKGLLGANMAIWREDLLRVNGFDSDIPPGCGEEVDLEWRLRRAGVKPTALLGRGAVVHLYHTTRTYGGNPENYRLQRQREGVVYVANGIDTVAADG